MTDRYHVSCASADGRSEAHKFAIHLAHSLDKLRRIELTSLRDTLKFDLNFGPFLSAGGSIAAVSNLHTCEQVRPSIDSRFTGSGTYSFAFALRTEYICFCQRAANIVLVIYFYAKIFREIEEILDL